MVKCIYCSTWLGSSKERKAHNQKMHADKIVTAKFEDSDDEESETNDLICGCCEDSLDGAAFSEGNIYECPHCGIKNKIKPK
jgi:hypothetical protein